MSNSLTVRLTDSRSSARSAPISYTPPVNPPPPSTSADLDLVRRRRASDPREAAPGRSAAAASSLTTLPIPGRIVRRAGAAAAGQGCPAEMAPGTPSPTPLDPRRARAARPQINRYFHPPRRLYPPMRVFLATLGAVCALLAGTAAVAGAQPPSPAQRALTKALNK